MKNWSKFWTWYISLTVGCGLVITTGLVSDWGVWYSGDITYRRQAEALLRGSLALDTDPGRLTWDMAWSSCRIQQPWGLGAPAWRVPFDSVAKLFGREAFPDRLSFATAIILLTYVVLRVFCHSPRNGGEGEKQEHLNHADAISAVLLLVLFPPFVTLCRTRFRMYEEAAAYAYLAGIALFCGTLAFVRRPRLTTYLIFALFAGLVGFVRPTLIAYGSAFILVATIYAWRLRWPISNCLLAPVLFCLGVGSLLLSNLERFGSVFEFGHRLNLNGLDVMRYVTRFQDPFRACPPLAAFVDLASSLFFANNRFNGFNHYQLGFFLGQARIIRWREFYFKTYDVTFLIMMLVSVFLVWRWWRRVRALKRISSIEIPAVAAWVFVSLGLLFGFYIYFPSVASRYLLDFGPGLAGSIWLFLSLIKNWLEEQSDASTRTRNMFFICCLIWWIAEVCTAEIQPAYASVRPVKYDELLQLSQDIQQYRIPPEQLPDEYALTTNSEHHYGLPFNGDGWDSVSGSTKAAVTLFVRDPEMLELVIGPIGGAELSNSEYEVVEAKIGLEHLKLVNIRSCAEGRILLFEGPQRPCYRFGLQVVALGFVKPEALDLGESKFRLLRVRWNRRTSSSTH